MRAVLDLLHGKALHIRMAVCVWMVCVLFSSLSVFATESPRSGDLVFCPLQNQWVKINQPSRPLSDLDIICAGDKLKAQFVEGLIRSGHVIGPMADGEKLFFAYAAKGDRSFTKLPLPNDPDTPPLSLARNEANAYINQVEYYFCRAQSFFLDQLPQPLILSDAANVHVSRFYKASLVLTAVSPRGPPLSL
jgi:hypothetical protein